MSAAKYEAARVTAEGNIEFEVKDGALWCTIDRPEKRNAMTTGMYVALEEAFQIMEGDSDVRTAVLTGAGSDVFSAGSDIKERIGTLTTEGWSRLRTGPTDRFFCTVKKPIIAAINGACVGGGMEMLLGTDIRVAVQEAWFALPEPRLGIIAASGSHVRLPRQIPYPYAMEMLLTGNRMDSSWALRSGLVNYVTDRDGFDDKVASIVESIVSCAPLAVSRSKEIVEYGLGLDTAFRFEHTMAPSLYFTEDAAEGRQAFLEKRKPTFKGK